MTCAVALIVATLSPPTRGPAGLPPSTVATVTPTPMRANAAGTPCHSDVPAVGSPVGPEHPPFPNVKNYDPCTNRITMTDDALKRSGGPYISRETAEAGAAGAAKPLVMRSYFTTYEGAGRMLGHTGVSTDVYPDREVWLVVTQMPPGAGPKPSLPAGAPTPRADVPLWFVYIVDATTGRTLSYGGRDARPAGLPPDTPEDLTRDAARRR